MAQVYYKYRKNGGYLEAESTSDFGIDDTYFGTTPQVDKVADWALGQKKWNGSSVASCTAQEITDYPSKVSEDDNAMERDASQSQLDSGGRKALRALALLMLDEINTLRDLHGLSQYTSSQLLNAIKSKIANGDAD